MSSSTMGRPCVVTDRAVAQLSDHHLKQRTDRRLCRLASATRCVDGSSPAKRQRKNLLLFHKPLPFKEQEIVNLIRRAARDSSAYAQP